MSAAPSSARCSDSPSWRIQFLLVLATLLCLGPFLHKAVHVDDYLFIRSARQILEHPLDPYGIEVNWYGQAAPLAAITQNPPLACYYLAAAGGVLGWSEIALHGALLLPAVAAVLGLYQLARRFCTQPALAAGIALTTPVFWLSATTLMCDIPMLALWLWALALWLRGMDTGRTRWFAGAAGLATLAVLTKYFALALLPLLAVDTLVRDRRRAVQLGWLALPVVALTGYEILTKQRYGHGMFAAASEYTRSYQHIGRLGWRVLVGLSFAGGGLLPVLALAPRLCSRKWALLGLLAVGLLAVGLPRIAPDSIYAIRVNTASCWWVCTQMACFVVGGLLTVALVLIDLHRTRSADSLLLALWTGGTLAFAAVVNWSVNGRSLLPLAPAVAILLVRQLQARHGSPSGWRQLWPLGLALGGAALVVCADARQAANARTAARLLHEQLDRRTPTLWFQGHWGFQYYMEAGGARPLDRLTPRFRPGDYLVLPTHNTCVWDIPPQMVDYKGNIEIPATHWLATLQGETGAGFYSDVLGPLPFALGQPVPQVFHVVQFRAPRPGGR